jgi:short-subunit dehydrogenase involved in D-alanine esterification of teichoic acids
MNNQELLLRYGCNPHQIAAKAYIQNDKLPYLDVSNIKSIEAVHSYLDNNYKKFDILVNNAGICLESTQKPSKVSLDIIRQTLETNFIGAIAVTQILLPLIYKSEAGRIVNISSGRGSLTRHSNPQSKTHSLVLTTRR